MKTTNFKPTEKLLLLAAIPLMMMALLSCVSEEGPELMGNKDNVLENILHLSNEEIFDAVETMPRPPGGMEGWTHYLNENLIYPPEAKRAGVEGTVYVSFVIDKDGHIIEPTILRGIGCGADEEALRVIQAAPDWIPGEQRGQKVNVKMHIPIRFNLADHKIKEMFGGPAGKKIDIVLLDEDHIRLNGKRMKTDELAKELARIQKIRQLGNGLITAVLSGGNNIKMAQVNEVQEILRDQDIRRISYLGSNAISPVLVFTP